MKYLATVIAQGIVAVAMFALSTLVARTAGAAELGVYGLCLGAAAFVRMTNTAFVGEPLTVFGNSRFRHAQRDYLRQLFLRSKLPLGGLVALVTAVILVVSLLHTSVDPKVVLCCGALAVVFPVYDDLLRAHYSMASPRGPLLASVAYGTVAACGLWWLSDVSALGGIGVVLAALVGASIVLAGALRGLRLGGGPCDIAEAKRVHWRFGRMTLTGNVLRWMSTQSFFVLLPAFVGLETTGELRGLVTLANPGTLPLLAIAPMLVGSLTRRAHTGDLRSHALRAGAVVVMFGVVCLVGLGLFGDHIVALLFGTSLSFSSGTLWIAASCPLAVGLALVLESVVRALERPEWIAQANLFGVLAVPLGVVLAHLYGAGGAFGAMVFSYVASAAILAVRLSKASVGPSSVS